MKMRCMECDLVHESKEIRASGQLTYVWTDGGKWHDAIDGRGTGIANLALDKVDIIVAGYDGCRGWP